MSGNRTSRKFVVAAALAVASSLGLIWGTSAALLWGTPSTATSVLLGRATYQPTNGNTFHVHREQPPDWGIVVQGRPALDVAVQMITFQPGTQSGWHSHPGPVFISVVAGEMTFYESDDPTCTPTIRHAGEGFLDVGDHAHIARNESDKPAMNVVTYFAPPGAALRIDQPNPGNCPF